MKYFGNTDFVVVSFLVVSVGSLSGKNRFKSNFDEWSCPPLRPADPKGFVFAAEFMLLRSGHSVNPE